MPRAAGWRRGIVLVCEGEEAACYRAAAGIEETAARFGLPLTLWECATGDPGLSACRRRELGAP